MKKIVITLTLILFLTPVCFAQKQVIIIKVKNNSLIARDAEVIAIPWNSLLTKNPLLEKDYLLVIDKQNGKTLLSQIVDNDGDGKADELLFQSDFPPKGQKEFMVTTVEIPVPFNRSLVFGKFVKGREDIAWENDRIANRIYGPALAKESNNGIDVWTKRVRYPIVEKWYELAEKQPQGSKDPYHEDRGEGADFFTVGKSLGDGASALWKNDSLYQPGVFSSYKFIATGPLRVIFEAKYNPVNYNGLEISEVRRISLDAGQNLNKIEVMYFSEKKDAEIEFAAGLVKRKNVESFKNEKNRWYCLWGPTNDESINEYLGLGMLFPKNTFLRYKEDSTHILCIGKTKIGKIIRYYTGFGWTRSGDYDNVNDWIEYLDKYARKLGSPLKITIN